MYLHHCAILILILMILFICVGCTSNVSPSQQTISTTKSTSVPTIQTTIIPSPKITIESPISTMKSITGPICECSKDIYNCNNFPLSIGVSALDCFNYCKSLGKGDIHKLDRDGDGKVCESK